MMRAPSPRALRLENLICFSVPWRLLKLREVLSLVFERTARPAFDFTVISEKIELDNEIKNGAKR